MNTDVLEKINQLSPERQQEVEDFINHLLSTSRTATKDDLSIAEMRKKNMGWAKGKIWMSEDFNDTPEDFNDYL